MVGQGLGGGLVLTTLESRVGPSTLWLAGAAVLCSGDQFPVKVRENGPHHAEEKYLLLCTVEGPMLTACSFVPQCVQTVSLPGRDAVQGGWHASAEEKARPAETCRGPYPSLPRAGPFSA